MFFNIFSRCAQIHIFISSFIGSVISHGDSVISDEHGAHHETVCGEDELTFVIPVEPEKKDILRIRAGVCDESQTTHSYDITVIFVLFFYCTVSEILISR